MLFALSKAMVGPFRNVAGLPTPHPKPRFQNPPTVNHAGSYPKHSGNQCGTNVLERQMRHTFGGRTVPELQLKSVQKCLALWRRAIVHARIRLASDALSPQQQRELWQAVDCREWFIKMVARDFEAELEQIDREIEDALRH
jgi:hypothetical protein